VYHSRCALKILTTILKFSTTTQQPKGEGNETVQRNSKKVPLRINCLLIGSIRVIFSQGKRGDGKAEERPAGRSAKRTAGITVTMKERSSLVLILLNFSSVLMSLLKILLF